jgi:acyl carrier protein
VEPVTTANEVDGWDSLSHVNLIMAVEGRFKIRFTQKELLTFKNVGDLLRAIESKIQK